MPNEDAEYITYKDLDGNEITETLNETREKSKRLWVSWEKNASPEQKEAREQFFDLLIGRAIARAEKSANKKADASDTTLTEEESDQSEKASDEK